MRKLSVNPAVKITTVIISTICFVLLVGMLSGIIFLADLGAYTDSYEVVRTSYIDMINYIDIDQRSNPTTYNDFLEIVDHYRADTLDYYSSNSDYLYAIKIGDRVITTNYNGEDNAYSAYINNVEIYNDAGDFLVEYEVTIYVPSAIPLIELFEIGYDLRYAIIIFSVITLSTLIVSLVFIMHSAGHRNDSDTIALRMVDKIPFDIHTCVLFAFVYLQLYFSSIFFSFGFTYILIIVGFITLDYLLGLNYLVSFSILIKAKELTKRTAIYKFSQISLIWKTIIVLIIWTALEFICIYRFNSNTNKLLMAWFISKVILVPAVITIAVLMQKIQISGKKIASGDLNHHLDTSRMFGDFKSFVNDLNSIRDGMSNAVEERMRSERFKTELITNVSHDIKTPLTSIINYVDLIKKEKPENETVKQYIDVLDRQSSRLKKLIEDLIEASKASTGNLKVELVPCELNVLLAQLSGEYEEALAKRNLELVVTPPSKVINIMADGRHLWRVIDNLMNNICKYAIEGTRVYVNLYRDDNKAFLTFKNISRAPLNISAEELMERFTRGDSSRNTEGSGLGLSIARSLTELQGGEFTLDIDGDLFKAILRFDILNTETEEDYNEQ